MDQAKKAKTMIFKAFDNDIVGGGTLRCLIDTIQWMKVTNKMQLICSRNS